MNRDGDIRLSTALTYLAQARSRPNLTVAGDTRVDRLVLERGCGRCARQRRRDHRGGRHVDHLRRTRHRDRRCAGLPRPSRPLRNRARPTTSPARHPLRGRQPARRRQPDGPPGHADLPGADRSGVLRSQRARVPDRDPLDVGPRHRERHAHRDDELLGHPARSRPACGRRHRLHLRADRGLPRAALARTAAPRRRRSRHPARDRLRHARRERSTRTVWSRDCGCCAGWPARKRCARSCATSCCWTRPRSRPTNAATTRRCGRTCMRRSAPGITPAAPAGWGRRPSRARSSIRRCRCMAPTGFTWRMPR